MKIKLGLFLNVSITKTAALLDDTRELFFTGITIGQFGFGLIASKERLLTPRALDGATVSPIERDWSGDVEDEAWAYLQEPPRQ